jgi:hypothetical protein
MQIILNEQIVESGVTADDIHHMLKACDKVILTKTYEPTIEEVKQLVISATKAELEKKRVVAKWNKLMADLKAL